jgi:ABC-type polysaccharide/polyol phosphate transport system ATPase subunit
MRDIDVRFERVSKCYRLRTPRWRSGRRHREFWALRDLSLDVHRGETLGLIGHNGAGKSTILKLLSRITAPSSGTITLQGRLAALIEVGSGFHPELTGRENVFLSGAILGMRRQEITAKLDRIIAFSGVGSYIDTPVKWYSSGMFVRLGFSVAAHLDADVLVVDEVLAVGDAAFQLQCYERIAELRRAGTTMIFISHDLGSIGRLCDQVALISHGELVACGAPADVITAYQDEVTTASVRAVADVGGAPTGTTAHISDVRFLDRDGTDVLYTATGSPLCARVEIEVVEPIVDAVIEVFYYSRDGRTLHCQQSTALGGGTLMLEPGRQCIEFTCDELGLQPGIYTIGAAVRERLGTGTAGWWYGTRALHVEPGKSVRGNFYAPHHWRWVNALAETERRPADV